MRRGARLLPPGGRARIATFRRAPRAYGPPKGGPYTDTLPYFFFPSLSLSRVGRFIEGRVPRTRARRAKTRQSRPWEPHCSAKARARSNWSTTRAAHSRMEPRKLRPEPKGGAETTAVSTPDQSLDGCIGVPRGTRSGIVVADDGEIVRVSRSAKNQCTNDWRGGKSSAG